MPKPTCKHGVFPELGCRLCELEGEVARLRAKLAKVDEVLESPELLEKLASVEHERWMRGAKKMAETENLSVARLTRWRNECFMPYAQLSEYMKGYDRDEAANSLAVVVAEINLALQEPKS